MVDMYGGVTCLSKHLIEKTIQLMSKEQRNAKNSTKFYTEVTQTLPIFDTLFLSLSVILDTKLLTHTHLRATEGLTYLLVSDAKVI